MVNQGTAAEAQKQVAADPVFKTLLGFSQQKIDELRETEVVNLTAAVKELTAMLRKAGPGAVA